MSTPVLLSIVGGALLFVSGLLGGQMGVERSVGSIQLQVDAMCLVERQWTQRVQLCGRGAREEAFR